LIEAAEPEMSDQEFDAREESLQYAARLKGLSLMRTGETYALAEFRVRDATLDEIAAYLAADGGYDDASPDERRRTNLQALLKAEHAVMAELETERRKANARGNDRLATAAALAEIRRRIMELSQAGEAKAPPQDLPGTRDG
jgi:hypothetical protein